MWLLDVNDAMPLANNQADQLSTYTGPLSTTELRGPLSICMYILNRSTWLKLSGFLEIWLFFFQFNSFASQVCCQNINGNFYAAARFYNHPMRNQI